MSVDAEHIMVCGPSGGGKSTFLREQHARHDGPSIFLTPKKNERKAATNPPKRVRKSSCNYPGDIQKAREWALGRDEQVQVIVDECQNAPTFNKPGEGPCKDMLHEDRSGGVKAIVCTQNPMDLHTKENRYGPIQQCEYWVFVGKAKTWHGGFFDGNQMGEMKQYMPRSNYEYVVIDPALSLEGEERIVYRGQTNRKYG